MTENLNEIKIWNIYDKLTFFFNFKINDKELFGVPNFLL
jgi:hypothetical protein